ncbi:MAG TPA: N-carbamoylputrescine amidase [Hyphomicrobium zavarzinii]|jgi:N-carbamoylputrescine amidase|uniref:N-carbamoylputrescine amidase n=1 Tax=Hyphomicrobium sp. DMF-1 TaxID=3019544 RepID=UPI0022EBF6EE|nr:N-carbamoylputrescine amidase [Hyphomicrobium sp. DMF-1]WBT37598.1 N-carbamoylputrescine amidase [Hyphomicrobium sp. DMF-1]HML42072.1 N-carbamoylputrescine amidase [Hyphomicrobium zavarzinii]
MKKRTITVAALQTSYGHDLDENIEKTEKLVRKAAEQGAEVVLPSELFEGIYFCTKQDPKWFETAHPVDEHPCVRALKKLAKKLEIVIPISFFEKDGPRYYNSIAIADADGDILGIYRKSHIPDGPGYQEKYYFRPGDTGFRTWKTKRGHIGVGICWDQWYPETARAMALQGAEVLFYPTAIGSEPYDAALDTHLQWQRAMQGHAVSNAIPIVAANRTGLEDNEGVQQKFYGHSFIADHRGELVESFGATDEGVLVHTFDLSLIESYRADWGFFRDRRTDLYAKSII